MNIFWNSNEMRLRAFWRLLLHTFLMIAIVGFASISLILAAFLIAGSDNIPLDDPTLGQELGSLVGASPLLASLSSIVTLLGVILATWVAGRFFDKRRFADFGFHLDRLWWMDLGFGLFLGALLMLGVFLVQSAAGWVEVTGYFAARSSFGIEILTVGVVFLAVGIQEELLSRGYHLKNLAEGLNFPALGRHGALLLAYLISSSIFGLLHILNPNTTWISTLNLVLAGLFLGLGFVLTRQLAIPIGLHITWNFFQGNVFGFPVSGMFAGPTFIQIRQGGPELWTGGAFGPEAGLLGLLAMLAGSLLTIAWVRATRGQARLQIELAEYQSRRQTGPVDHLRGPQPPYPQP
jgi:uncharacterized protein